MIFNICKAHCSNKNVASAIHNRMLKYLSVRNVSTQCERSVGNDQRGTKFVKVFEYPAIRIARIVSRFKLYHTTFTILAIPSSIYLHNINLIESAHIYSISIGLGGCLVFYSTSFLLNNLIGAVYISEARDAVKLSYIGFWGQRIDTVCPINDIVPLSNQSIKNQFLKLSHVHRTAPSEVLKIATEDGIILEPQAFDEVFFRISEDITKQKDCLHEKKTT